MPTDRIDETAEPRTTTNAHGPAPPLLRHGDRGAQVEHLQHLLAGHMVPGPVVDGIFGSGTEHWVRTFQRMSGLEVDGIVGEATWRALRTGPGRSRVGAAGGEAPGQPIPMFGRGPLPDHARDDFKVAQAVLREQIATSDDPRAWRYRCWLDRLDDHGDGRVIEWHRIYPSTSGPIGGFLIAPRDLTEGSPVDQRTLQDTVEAEGVDAAAHQVPFMTWLRSHIAWSHQMADESILLDNFRRLHDDVDLAIDQLENWSQGTPFGGGSLMPPAYRDIKAWIRRRQDDPASVYNCR